MPAILDKLRPNTSPVAVRAAFDKKFEQLETAGKLGLDYMYTGPAVFAEPLNPDGTPKPITFSIKDIKQRFWPTVAEIQTDQLKGEVTRNLRIYGRRGQVLHYVSASSAEDSVVVDGTPWAEVTGRTQRRVARNMNS